MENILALLDSLEKQIEDFKKSQNKDKNLASTKVEEKNVLELLKKEYVITKKPSSRHNV
jgi:hypothetical protein